MNYLKRVRGPVALYQLEGPENYNEPVHENLVLAALYQQRNLLGLANANFVLWADPAINEFLRGVFWNDDPGVLMFLGKYNNDNVFSSGAAWSTAFAQGEYASTNDWTNITGRSHFWDLQFVHGMACTSGEPPTTTRYRVLMWAELMYKLSIGQAVTDEGTSSTPADIAGTLLTSVRIPANPAQYDPSGDNQTQFSAYFNATSVPPDTATLQTLLTESDPYTGLDIGKRAIGSVMHLIQDSFARGHTRRWLRNPQNLVNSSADEMVFQAGTFGNFGAVITFHSYKGQDEDDHNAFDGDPTDAWYSWSDIDYRDPASFDPIVGARNAISWCTQLLAFWHARKPWEDGPQALLESAFVLDGNATNADTTVNEDIPLLSLDVRATGTGPAGIQDPVWLVLQNGVSEPAQVIATSTGWMAPFLGTQWIARANVPPPTSNTYVYRIGFTLPANADASTVRIVGRCAADDQCTGIQVNGTPVTDPFADGLVPDWTTPVPFALSSGFRAGANTIDFIVTNSSGPTGFLAIFDGATVLPAS